MSYIGNQPTSVAFPYDTFSGTGSQTAFTMQLAPANTASVLVFVSGVKQDPSTYSVSGTTLTFSAAPPSGTSNISAIYLGIPASGVTTTAYRTLTEFTATAGQTTFTPPSYTAGYITVLRNGVQLGTADFTATNGTTVVLATGATAGDLITTISFLVSSVLNAIPAVAGAVSNTYLGSGVVLAANMGANGTWAPTGTVLQVVNTTYNTPTNTTSTSFVDSGLSLAITPKFTASKILVLVEVNGLYVTGGSNVSVNTRIVRNSTTLSVIDTVAGYHSYSGDGGVGGASLSYLDSPATTSSTTYKMQYASTSGSNSVYINGSNPVSGSTNTVSSLTLMEIAG